jgi:hypothetical protein
MMDDDVSTVAWIMYGGLLLLTLLYTALRRFKLDASSSIIY